MSEMSDRLAGITNYTAAVAATLDRICPDEYIAVQLSVATTAAVPIWTLEVQTGDDAAVVVSWQAIDGDPHRPFAAHGDELGAVILVGHYVIADDMSRLATELAADPFRRLAPDDGGEAGDSEGDLIVAAIWLDPDGHCRYTDGDGWTVIDVSARPIEAALTLIETLAD